MNSSFGIMKNYVAAGALTAILGAGGPAHAAGAPDFSVTYPTGIACSGFDLQVEGWDVGKSHSKQFTDRNGILRIITAGTGYALTYTNLATAAKLSTKSNGFVDNTTNTTYALDGTQTKSLTGHNVVFMFPTDFPAGPSTTVYAGRVVIFVDLGGNFHVLEESGKKIDICASLSP